MPITRCDTVERGGAPLAGLEPHRLARRVAKQGGHLGPRPGAGGFARKAG